MKAFVYAIPIDDDTIKIGSHSGTIQKLISRYQTTTNKKYLSQGLAYGVEKNARLWMEMMISTVLKRYGGWIEGEKFNISVKGHFCSLADHLALPNSRICLSDYIDKVGDKVNRTNDYKTEIEMINEKLESVKLRKLREKLLKEERKEAEACSSLKKNLHEKNRESNDPYMRFIEEKIISANRKELENRIKRGVLYAIAEKYIITKFPEIEFTRKDAETIFTAKFGKPKSTRGRSDGLEWVGIGYKGLQLIPDDE